MWHFACQDTRFAKTKATNLLVEIKLLSLFLGVLRNRFYFCNFECSFFLFIAISFHRSSQSALPEHMWSRLGSRHSGRAAIKLREMRTTSDNIMAKLDDLTSSVEFIESKMMKYECDQMSKEMKQDEEKWKREEYKGVYANIKKSRQFGEVGCGGGLQYMLVPKTCR